MDVHIKQISHKGLLSKVQHANTMGKSVDTA